MNPDERLVQLGEQVWSALTSHLPSHTDEQVTQLHAVTGAVMEAFTLAQQDLLLLAESNTPQRHIHQIEEAQLDRILEVYHSFLRARAP